MKPIFSFWLKALLYLLSAIISWNAMKCVDFEKFLKPGYGSEAQVLYVLCVLSLAYLAGSFVISFLYL